MLQETETYSAETPFAEFLNDTMSGANTVSEHFPGPPTDSTSTDAAGAPPAEPANGSGTNPTSPEGATPAPSTATTTDITAEPSPAAPPESNPFEAAAPLTYTVNGQPRTFDGIAYVPGVGAVIQDADIQKVQQRLSERDNLYERSQQQHEQVQALERLMTWTQTVDGKPTELTGPQALEAQRVQLGRTLAALDTLTTALKDPETFASLVALDAQNNVVLNQNALQHLATRSELNELNAERMVRQHWATINAAPQSQSTPINIEQAAPKIAAHWATQYGNGVLTDVDTQFLATQVPRYLRAATRDDVSADPTLKVGDPVMDASFTALVSDRAELRKATASAVSTATTVATENAQKMRAALLPNGKAPNAASNTNTRPVNQIRQPQPSQTQADRDALFLKMEQAAAGAM